LRTDAAGERALRARAEREGGSLIGEGLRGGRTGKKDRVGPAGAEIRGRRIIPQVGLLGLVDLQAVDDGIGFLERLDERVAVEVAGDHEDLRVVEAAGGDHRLGQGLGGCLLGLALDLEVQVRDAAGGRLADAGKAQEAERADVLEQAEELLEEKPHAIRTREHDPIVAAELEHDVGEILLGNLAGDPDERQLDHLGAERGEFGGELRGLVFGAGDGDAATGEGLGVATHGSASSFRMRVAAASGAA